MATPQGVLTGEPMRGVKFSLMDCLVHSDPAHRGGGQIGPASRRVIYAAQLTAKPQLVEPIYLVEMQTTRDVLGSIYSLLSQKRGFIFSEEQKGNTPLIIIKAYLPVAESFGFTQSLRESTSGKAFPQMMFHHWSIIDGDPFIEGTLSNKIAMEIRKRKGMPLQFPTIDKYHDKL